MRSLKNGDNEVRIYPVPKEAVLKEDYCLRIRPEGADEWQELKTYRVRVDMHDVREASMAYFDFSGKVEVEITFSGFYTVYRADIRPLSLHIQPVLEPKRVTFTLERPANLSVEINKDRFHNLHLFAGAMEEIPSKETENVLVVKGNPDGFGLLSDEVNKRLEQMPKGRLLYVEAGIYYIAECIWHLPSDTEIYLEGGAVLIGGMVSEHGNSIRIFGRGMLYLADFARFTCMNGLRLNHCENITIENLMFINPPHYTAALGGCKHVTVRGIKSFSCEGWSDGVDMMSCQDITVEQGFLRTSDDCIAVYGSRWDNHGDSRKIRIKDMTLWADVAHPLMIGTHGDAQHGGDVIEDIVFENIDILEHHEFQPEYLGAMTINAGDKNLVRNVWYKNIRIEPFEHGKVLDIQVKWNRDYNPAPGRGIENIRLEEIYVSTGDGEEVSVIDGYSEKEQVKDVIVRRMYRDGYLAKSMEEANIRVGTFTKDICICGEELDTDTTVG